MLLKEHMNLLSPLADTFTSHEKETFYIKYKCNETT